MSDPVTPRSSTQAALKIVFLCLLLAVITGCFIVIGHEDKNGAGALFHLIHYGTRVLIVALGLVFWFQSQALIGGRQAGGEGIIDWVHGVTAPAHAYLEAHPRLADRILIVSSACIDIMGVSLLVCSIIGPTVRPFIALLILFVLRQISQSTTALPAPPGMIWRNPGFPSLLVTYDVGNDFFFSGHTAIAVLCAIEMGQISPWLGLAVGAVACGEIAVVIVLRAHYTMDVLAALAVTWCAFGMSKWVFAFF